MENKEKFIYLCGPTVYNKVHIGNMRPIVTFDIILRSLKKLDKNVKLIHNITDIDDKIIQKAIEEKTDEKNISEKYFEFYLSMLESYNVKTIDLMPKVSENIFIIESFLKELLKKDFLYESNNSFYFKTKLIKEYGEVSKNQLDELIFKDSNFKKENDFDFVVWKNKNEGKTWETFFGKGRPGWHTECAAFVFHYAKQNSLLIHGGGIDLKFPHHENENAQFRALANNSISNNWMHIGIINFNNQKMSKSLGNIIYADQFLNDYNTTTNASDLYRLLIISTSIKSTIEISDEMILTLIKKNNQIEKIINYILLNRIDIKVNIEEKIIVDLSKGNFSNVYKEINHLIKQFNILKNDEIAMKLFEILKLIGFTITNKKIDEELINVYNEWKKELKNKNYEKSDSLRKILVDKKLI